MVNVQNQYNMFEAEQLRELRRKERNVMSDYTKQNYNMILSETHICTKCGGKFIKIKNSSEKYCNYCGSKDGFTKGTVMVNRPDYIIPFKISFEECKEIFYKNTRKMHLLPSKYKNPSGIIDFQKMYLPSWIYNFRQSADYHVEGKKIIIDDDYEITKSYMLTGKVDAEYSEMEYMATTFWSQFDEEVFEFDIKDAIEYRREEQVDFIGMVPFVYKENCKKNATQIANKALVDKICKLDEYEGYTINSFEMINNQIETVNTEEYEVLYPIWVLSYYRDGKIAYAVVNGQSGKIAFDRPVSLGKIVLVSSFLTIPIMSLLNFVSKLTPIYTIKITAMLLCIFTFLFCVENNIIKNKNHLFRFKDNAYYIIVMIGVIVVNIIGVPMWGTSMIGTVIYCVSGIIKLSEGFYEIGRKVYIRLAIAVITAGMICSFVPSNVNAYNLGTGIMLVALLYGVYAMFKGLDYICLREIPLMKKKEK